MATAVNGSEGVAIIDGDCFTTGQSVDGFQLVAVDRNSAVLTSAQVRVTLRLVGPASIEGDR